MAAVLLALLFFSPLAFVYGRHRARRAVAAKPHSTGRQVLQVLLVPALFGACLCLALAETTGAASWTQANLSAILTGTETGPAPTFYTGNRAVDAVVWLALTIGGIEMLLFFVSVPYALAGLIAAGLLILRAGGTDLLGKPAVPEGASAAASSEEGHPGP